LVLLESINAVAQKEKMRSKRITTPSHPSWILSNHVITRGLLAVKFLIAASFFGPDAMGIISLLLILYAVVESLTEFGLVHALIQAEHPLQTDELRAIWWALLARGMLMSALIVTIANISNQSLENVTFLNAAYLLAVYAVIKSTMSPQLYLAQRNRRFDRVFVLGITCGLADTSIAIVLLLNNCGILSIFISLVFSEILKVILSHFVFVLDKDFLKRVKSPNFTVKKFAKFGRWIWMSNCLNFVLNQSDKLVTASLVGIGPLGLYSMSHRLSQLGISDVAIAMGQYLFPSFSRLQTENRKLADKLLGKALVYMFVFSLTSAICISSFAELLPMILGDAWNGSVPIIRVIVVAMVIGSLISVFVAYHRAIGFPNRVVIASIAQLAIFIPTLIILTLEYGVIGAATSTVIGNLFCLVVLIFFYEGQKLALLTKAVYFIWPLLTFFGIYILSDLIENIWLSNMSIAMGFCVIIFAIYSVERRLSESCP